MKALLEFLNYDRDDFSRENRTADQMKQDASEFAKRFEQDHEYDSCIVVITSHGDHGKFLGADGNWVEQEELFKLLIDNEALAGKPKIFIIDACRGSKGQPFVFLEEGCKKIAELERESKKAFMSKIPIGADVCVFYSTTPGYIGWENSHSRSPFIHAICEEFGFILALNLGLGCD